MPTDLLLPAFALTLVLNAAIVALAIRSLRTERGSGGRTPTIGRDHAPERPSLAPAAGRPAGGASEPPAGPTPDTAGPVLPSDVRLVAGEPVSDRTVVAAPDGLRAAGTTVAVTPPASPVRTEGGARPGRRRKFSLPPAEDHEKVSRSIQTFLAGTDAPPSPVPEDTPPVVTPAPVVTVAAIQLVGGGGRALLERTVHSTARSTDVVSVDRRGRVRVVLTGTGELAAHAYLRRIRAIVEPALEAEDPPSQVVIATATELDGSVATARRRADRRLATALRAAAAEVGRAIDPAALAAEPDEELDLRPEPRASGD